MIIYNPEFRVVIVQALGSLRASSLDTAHLQLPCETVD